MNSQGGVDFPVEHAPALRKHRKEFLLHSAAVFGYAGTECAVTHHQIEGDARLFFDQLPDQVDQMAPDRPSERMRQITLLKPSARIFFSISRISSTTGWLVLKSSSGWRRYISSTEISTPSL